MLRFILNLFKRKPRVRSWLGLPDLAKKTDLQAFEIRQKQRAKASHDAILGMLNRIEQRLINQHVGEQRQQPSFAQPVLDWETVQMLAMADLQNKPEPKEN